MPKKNGNQRAKPGHFSLVNPSTNVRVEAIPSGTSQQFAAAKSRAIELGNLAVFDGRGTHVAGPMAYQASPPAPPPRTHQSSGYDSSWRTRRY
jgi:hypothetical protein